MNNNCCDDFKKLKEQFMQLLISAGQNNVAYKPESLKNILIKEGFSKKIANLVILKMNRSQRPYYHYSKVNGKLKKPYVHQRQQKENSENEN